MTKGLGLGVYDYVIAGELGGDWVRGGVSVGFGRRFLGSTAQLNRLDGWQGSAGAWLNANHRLQIGTFLDWHGASFIDTAPYRLAGGYLAYRLNSELKLQLYSGGGLSTSSPKLNAGVTIIYRPRRREH